MLGLNQHELIANLIGAAGYLVFALSPLSRKRTRYLWLHAAAMVPIAVHYVMLGALPGALLSLTYLGADIAGFARRHRGVLIGVLSLMGVGAFAWSYSHLPDFLGLFGTLVFLLSRVVENYRRTLLIAGLSTVAWGAYGWFEGSYSQLSFSFAYAAFCFITLWRLREDAGATRRGQ